MDDKTAKELVAKGLIASDMTARDLIAMWQSELTAMAADRELREYWAATMALWAQAAKAAIAVAPHGYKAGSTSAAEPPGPAPAAAASQPGLGEIEQLNRRIAELEQRLAEFLGGKPGSGAAAGGV